MGHDLNALRAKMGLGSGKRIPSSKITAWLIKHFDYKIRKDGDEYCICNPFDGDTGFNFNINPGKCTCHDWRGDHWAGPVSPKTGKRNCSFINFVKIYRNCSYAEAVREVLDTKEDISEYLRPEARHSTVPERKIEVALPPGTERLAGAGETDPQAAIILNWLFERGYCLEDVDRYDLHYLAMEVYWPYYEFDNLVYWQSRNRYNKVYRFPDIVVHDKEGKAIGKTDGSKSDFLYGFDNCEMATYVTITESIFGQYSLGEQALASGGAALTGSQLGKIKILGPKKGIILAPDNDKAGIKSVVSNYTLLKQLGYPIFYSLPPLLEYKKDGKTCYTKDWNELIQELKWSHEEVRAAHDKAIKKISIVTLNELHSALRRLR